MNQVEYIEVCKMMNYYFWVTEYDSKLSKCCPSIWKGRIHTWFRNSCYETGRFDNAMNCVLVVNFVMIILESYYDLHDLPEPGILANLELQFSFIYVCELVCKFSVISWGEFWSSSANAFDFWTTIILCYSSS